MSELISLSGYKMTDETRPLLMEMRRYIWDANMYIALGKDDGYIHGKRCYEKLMKLMKRLEGD